MVIFSLTFFSLCGVARAVAGAFLDNYDTPLYSKTGNAPGQDEEVFCTFYNGFMVKQEWYVGIGGSEPTGPVDVVPEQGNKTTRCDDATAPGQLQAPVDPNSDASLDGVLGSYIFLSAPTAVGNQIFVFQASSRALAASGPWFIAGPRNTWRNPLWIMLPGGLDL